VEIERRVMSIDNTECRVLMNSQDEPEGITGLAGVYRIRTDIGPFFEEIEEGAFKQAIASSDIRGLQNHDPNYLLGRTKSGTMSVWEDSRGMHYDIPKLPESRGDTLESVGRGDIDGNSFGFTVPSDGSGEQWIEQNEESKPLRRITRFERIFDVGPVVFPQYDEDTKVTTRSAHSVLSDYEQRKLEVVVQQDDSITEPVQQDFSEVHAQRNSVLRDKQLKGMK